MIKLTTRQNQVFQLIQEQVNLTGSPPTRAEIAKLMGFKSPNAAEDHLRALARKGVIELVPGTSRGIRIIKDQGLPIVGRVAAGQPILAEENIEDNFLLNKNLFKPKADYLLRVQGDSMTQAGIMHGDLLAVHATPNAESGQIVVARLQDEVTVKRLKRNDDGSISLMPANPSYEPIEVSNNDSSFYIEGQAVGVFRLIPGTR